MTNLTDKLIKEMVENLNYKLEKGYFTNGKDAKYIKQDISLNNMSTEGIKERWEHNHHIYKDMKSIDLLILSIYQEFIVFVTDKVKQIHPYVFKEDVDIDFSLEIVKDYIAENELDEISTYEELEENLIQSISNSYYENCFFYDILKENTDYFLDEIKYQEITEKVYKYSIEPNCVIEILDDFVNDIYSENLSLEIKGIEDLSLCFNIFPYQNGKDEGSKIGSYLDYLAYKDDEYYSPYYIHQENGPSVPESFNKILKSQDNSSSAFWDSLKEKMTGLELSCVFFVTLNKLSIKDIFNFFKNEIVIPKETNCGLVNIVHGAGSSLDIELVKEMKVSAKNSLFQIDEDGFNCYGYSLSSIYGDLDYLYKPL